MSTIVSLSNARPGADAVTGELSAAVADSIKMAVAEIERGRRLPAPLVDTLTRAGLFGLYTPVEHGGAELDPAAFCRIIEAAGRLDASTAWCLWNGNCGFAAPLLDPAAAEAVHGPGTPVGNSARVAGAAVPADGGFTLTGRWDLVSGSDHQPWLTLFAMVMEGDTPRMHGGNPDIRAMHVRRDHVTIEDNWHVLGLRGTSSNTVLVDRAFVPDELAPSPFAPSRIDRTLYRIPVFAVAACGGAAVCLGIAQGAIDDLLEIARTKTSIRGPEPLAALPTTHTTVAEADVRLRAARHELHRALDVLTDTAAAQCPAQMTDRARLRAAMTLAARTAREVTLQMFELGSSSAIFDSCPLSRRARDVLVAAQHVMLQPIWSEQAGRVQFGLEPTLPII